jgi:hypothetical protein
MTEPLLYTTKAAEEAGGFKTTKLYELIGSGALDARKLGSRTMITAESLKRYIASLPKANIGRAANLPEHPPA